MPLPSCIPSFAAMYSELDTFAKARLTDLEERASLKTTCSSCTGAVCCTYLALCGTGEAMHLGLRLLSKPDWRHIIARVAEQARLSDYAGIDEANYAKRRIPCAFLVSSEGTKRCGVYEDRPAPCRYLYSFDAPKECEEGGNRRAPDLNDLTAEVGSANIDFSEFSNLPFFVAPIPIMVLFAFHTLVIRSAGGDYSPEDKALVNSSLVGVTPPDLWMDKHFRRLVEAQEAREKDPNYRSVIDLEPT